MVRFGTFSSQTVRALVAAVLLLALAAPPPARAYSVLTHEVVIDLLWDDQIRPLLLERFPSATPEEMKEAHAYAYGGAVIQDLGYYPFGSKYFSDLVHYVRSGDFVLALLHDSRDIKEYAFALGALSHYASDLGGHPAVNRAVGLTYPRLARKFGPVVTYNDDPAAHIKVEFSFDVLQVASNRYNFDQYHDYIGFEVAQDLLERAFQETYGLPLHKVITHEEMAIGTYRWSIGEVIPEMTKVALVTRGDRMAREYPTFDRKKFLYRLSRADYERAWGTKYRRPGVGAKIIAAILKVMPHLGPFRALKYKDPSPETEQMYLKSVNATVDEYRAELKETRARAMRLDDRDFDTGKETRAGEYALTDDTYSQLVRDLARRQFQGVTPQLRTNILQFYDDQQARNDVKRDRRRWRETTAAVQALRAKPAEDLAAATSPSQ